MGRDTLTHLEEKELETLRMCIMMDMPCSQNMHDRFAFLLDKKQETCYNTRIKKRKEC